MGYAVSGSYSAKNDHKSTLTTKTTVLYVKTCVKNDIKDNMFYLRSYAIFIRK